MLRRASSSAPTMPMDTRHTQTGIARRCPRPGLAELFGPTEHGSANERRAGPARPSMGLRTRRGNGTLDAREGIDRGPDRWSAPVIKLGKTIEPWLRCQAGKGAPVPEPKPAG